MECGQDNCTNDASHRYTWPGEDETGICDDHKPKLEALANALGFHLQTIPID